MKVVKQNVYDLAGLDRPENAAGFLTSYVPEGPAMPLVSKRLRPAALILPGGAYAWCSPREAEPVAMKFCAMGWAAFVLVYSCAPHRFPTSLREAAAAMKVIRETALGNGIDPRMVAAVGFSAGGHLCGTLGTMYDCPEVADIASAEILRPDALGLCYPVAVSWGKTHADSFENISGGDPALKERLSLERLVRPDMPPTFVWHTRDDNAVPSRNSMIVANALSEAGVRYALHIYDHGRHGVSTGDVVTNPDFDVPALSWDVTGWPEAMIRFFEDTGLRIHDEEVAQ